MNVSNTGANQIIVRQQVIRTVRSMTVSAEGNREANNRTIPVKFSESASAVIEEKAHECNKYRGEYVRDPVEMAMIFVDAAEKAGMPLPDFLSEAVSVYEKYRTMKSDSENAIIAELAGIRKE